MPDDWFPLFDVHMHYSPAFFDRSLESFEQYGVKAGINLWGTDYRGIGPHGTSFDEMLDVVRARRLDQWVQFYWPNWREFAWRPREFVEHLCAEMRRFDALGCRGLKVWKDLGMFILMEDGSPATVDDPRLEPVWETAAALRWTVAMHQADPTRAWAKPVRSRLTRAQIFEARDRVLARHPEITFILCHNGNDVESVAGWAALMERFPQALGDLDRDPTEHDSVDDVRAFLERYADRILFGTDLGMPDERPPDDPWCMEFIFVPWRRRIRSWGLSDSTFEKITWKNGERLFLTR